MAVLPVTIYDMKADHPKVILIDLQSNVRLSLWEAGYNVVAGTFGSPYPWPGSGYSRLAETADLPGLAETEIVVVNLDQPGLAPPIEPAGNIHDLAWWAKPEHNFVDPRPVAMYRCRRFIDRIFSHGGLVVLFCSHKVRSEYIWGRVKFGDLKSESRQATFLDNWSLLAILQRVDTVPDPGTEVYTTGADAPLCDILGKFSSELFFDCTLQADGQVQPLWTPLATNKYQKTIAAIIALPKEKGRVVLLPQVRNQAAFVPALFESVLPDLAPHLFPHHAGGRWLHLPEYELPRVLDLHKQIAAVEESSRQRRLELEREIEAERQRTGYLHELLRETGDPLVRAVKTALETLGFTSVIDSDRQKSHGERRREDLQIRDGSPIILVEAKGIAGLPPEHEAVQVWKYLAPRMTEWKRTDVRGLSIINHQRHVPALERNRSPFSADVLTNAQENEFGVMTTWDLYRLVRNFLRLGWTPDNVKPLFYRRGRIEPVPLHYEYVGAIQHFYPKSGAVTILIEGTGLRVGDRISYELPIEFIEQDVTSLQVDQQPVNEATPSMIAGIKTALTKDQAQKGTRIFRVRT